MIVFGIIYAVMFVLTYIAIHDKGNDDGALFGALFWPVVWSALLGLIIYDDFHHRKTMKAMQKAPQLTIAQQNEHLYAEISREIDADNRDWEKRFDQAEREWKVAHLKQAGGATSPCTCQIHLAIREDAIMAEYIANKEAEEIRSICVYCGEEDVPTNHVHYYPEERKKDFMGYPVQKKPDGKVFPKKRTNKNSYGGL